MAKPTLLKDFLQAVLSIHRTGGGTQETSFYTALNNLLDGAGHALKPRVRCVMQLKNLGAGNPDGGLFTADQFDRTTAEVKNLGAPSRGVIEVKSPAEPVNDTATTAQISKYWDRYKLVLVTNLREWLLIGERGGQRTTLERFTLAPDETSFWQLAAHPAQAQNQQGQAFEDFLTRVLQHNAPLADPKDLAALLASYAREARHRVEIAGDTATAPLSTLKSSLEKALGLTFDGDKGEQFFRSTLVQTLFYGMFAAWVLQCENAQTQNEKFDWQKAAHNLHVPMVSALFEQLTLPSKLKPLKLAEVLDWATDALNRVDKETFFKKFEADRAVQYFYEPFLESFDPELRRDLGVWYTPEEIVRYQVARVDHLLQTELGIPDGLADPNVVVLDPCCGTGAYLVEVLRLIGEKLKAQGADAMTAHHIKQAATTRLFGFELLPAPYVVAHLQMGIVLRKLGAPLQNEERAGVYLTNSLTGWEPPPPGSPKEQIEQFPEIAQEREAAEKIKRGQPILVILGNPPYNGYAGASIAEERDLSNAYRVAKTGPQPQGQGLNDLYVRFFRMAERQIAEHAGRGIISYISNYSWLDGLSHTAMRERFLEVFNHIWIDNLHGDKYRTGKLTPEGLPDPSAFSTPSNREGIQVGTAIATLVCTGLGSGNDLTTADGATPPAKAKAPVQVRSFWGTGKLQSLAECDGPSGPAWQSMTPVETLGRVFAPRATAAGYLDWPRLPELFPVSYPGVKTSRDAGLISIERTELEARMKRYFDPKVADASIAQEIPALIQSSGRFNAVQERKEAIHHGKTAGYFVRYCYRPMDIRWLFWYPIGKLLDEKRSDYAPQAFPGNLWLFTTGRTRKDLPEPAFATHLLADLNLQDSGTRGIPLYLSDETQASADPTHWRENLSANAVQYLHAIQATAKDLFFHSLAVTQSLGYRTENSGGLRQDWPRIPLPATRDALLASAALGREVAALLDTETPAPGVTSGTIRPELRPIAVISRVGGGALKPTEFALTAGWGSGGQGGITMPGKGKTEPRTPQASEQAATFGSAPTLDVYLNATAYWKNVPQPVWDFTIGGYQVMKKWLSYREQRVLGRALTMAEIMEVTAMARRLAALVLLQPQLDANYRAIAAATWAFADVA